MRKAASIALSILMILSLTSCGNHNTNVNNTTEKEEVGTLGDLLNNDTQEEETGSLEDLIPDTNDTENTSEDIKDEIENTKDETESNKDIEGTEIDASEILSQICEFRAIDCGQGDSILIHSTDFDILIDAGESKNAKAIMNVLDNKGVKTIDLLVATHPHSDHIGGMQTIVENYDIENILMSPTGHTSQTYENLLLAIDEKDIPVTKAEVGNTYSYGDLKLEVIGPCDEYNDLNNDSVVLIASYGETDVLLTGDAEMQAEKDYVEYLDDIEVLKVGHHGSNTSTSENLLDISTPEVAVISCGVDNQYGHPHSETLEKLAERNIETFRTDISGDIIIRTNGKEYSIESGNGDINYSSGRAKDIEDESNESNENNNNSSTEITNEQNETNVSNEGTSNTVYTTASGKKYHSSRDCSRLWASKDIREISEEEAISRGLVKCAKCW